MNDYPEIRANLVEFARGKDRPQTLKDHAEVLITIIDAMAKDMDDPALKTAFFQAYKRFYRAAHSEPLPVKLEPGEIAAAFGLLDPDTHQ